MKVISLIVAFLDHLQYIYEHHNDHVGNCCKLWITILSLNFPLFRFLLEVVRVSVSEIRSVRLSLLNSGPPPDGKGGQHTPSLLVHLSHHLLLTLLHLTISGKFKLCQIPSMYIEWNWENEFPCLLILKSINSYVLYF